MGGHTKVVVVGAGPVGSLAALYAATRGDQVEVYELRGDLRDESTTPLGFTKSINLALSERGVNALRKSRLPDLVHHILGETIPMHGRMIHGSSVGKPTSSSQAYDAHGRHISAIDRHSLNTRLLNELAKMPNVELFFNHKLTGADFDAKRAWFEVRRPGAKVKPGSRSPETEVTFDFLIGADGAHSATRFHMMKFAQMDFSQQHIDTLWCEFTIPPTPGKQFAISPNHLHIWPAGTFMFIAIPSLDRSFTCTLFAPTAVFKNLGSGSAEPNALEDFFTTNFPGVVPDHISVTDLLSQFQNNPHLPLVNIKTSPHHFGSSVVILGDAANAIVPFYGQGMNAGLESVRVLFDLLDSYKVYSKSSEAESNPDTDRRRAAALTAYTAQRVPDAHCIADLALENYIEMRDSVRSPLYLTRKFVEESLDRFVPWLGWSTQYSRVSFGNERYSEVAKQTAKQGYRLGMLGGASVLVLVALGIRAGRAGLFRRRA